MLHLARYSKYMFGVCVCTLVHTSSSGSSVEYMHVRLRPTICSSVVHRTTHQELEKGLEYHGLA